MKTVRHASIRCGKDDYLDLMRPFPLRAICTDAELDRAMRVVRKLAIRGEGNLLPGEQDYLETLTILIEDFDRQQAPAPRLRGLELLHHLAPLSPAQLDHPRPWIDPTLLHGSRNTRQALRKRSAAGTSTKASATLTPMKNGVSHASTG